eukprot:9466567-Pyramimonas_sp.AAC.1
MSERPSHVPRPHEGLHGARLAHFGAHFARLVAARGGPTECVEAHSITFLSRSAAAQGAPRN